MKKLLIALFIIKSILLAQVENRFPDKNFLNSNITIIDIRTKSEWIETGIIKNSKTITFFDEKGQYDAKQFVNELNKYIKPNEKFALICRTGSRTKMISNFLDNNGYKDKVINLKGGIFYLKKFNYKLIPYKKGQ